MGIWESSREVSSHHWRKTPKTECTEEKFYTTRSQEAAGRMAARVSESTKGTWILIALRTSGRVPIALPVDPLN